MPRKYKPVELPLKPITGVKLDWAGASCPRCEAKEATVLGRLGLRLVFLCPSCNVRFYRHRPEMQNQFI